MSATITILGDNPLYITQNSGDYVDPGATAYHADGSPASEFVTGDPVNTTFDVGTEFEIIYSVYENDDDASNLLATATRSVIIVADTSNEDDSSPDSGDTQTTEENIMSRFTFNKDKQGTMTPQLLKRDEKLVELQSLLDAHSAGASDDIIDVSLAGVLDGDGVVADGAMGLMSDGSFSGERQNLISILESAKAAVQAQSAGSLFVSSKQQGTAASFSPTMQAKDFLSNLHLKGLESCGDIEVRGELIFTKPDGESTAQYNAKDLAKDVSIVFGVLSTTNGKTILQPHDPLTKQVSGIPMTSVPMHTGGFVGDASPHGEDFDKTSGGTPTSGVTGEPGDSEYGAVMPTAGQAGEAALTGSSALRYLALTKMDGSVVFKEFDIVNDLVTTAGGGGMSSTLSLLAQMESIKELKDIVRFMFAELGFVSEAEIDALELKMTNDMVALMHHINDVESQLAGYIEQQDANRYTFSLARINELGEDIQQLDNLIHLTGAASGSGGSSVVFESSELNLQVPDGATFEGLSQISCWHIDVFASQEKNWAPEGEAEELRVSRDGEFDLDWEAEMNGNKLKVTVHTEGCDDAPAIRINAIWAGDLDPSMLDDNRADAEVVDVSLTYYGQDGDESDDDIKLGFNAAGSDASRKIDEDATTGIPSP